MRESARETRNKETDMRVLSKLLIAAAAAGASVLPASAAPIAAPFGLQQAVAATADAQVQTVQWRRGWRGGGGWIGPAIVGSAIIGGAIAASRPWGYGYYGYGPGYYDDYAYAPGYTYAPAPSYGYVQPGYGYVQPGYGYVQRGGGDVAYCEQRFRSYNRATGTYTGYDGQQHPCP
jgi:hypothetical protein